MSFVDYYKPHTDVHLSLVAPSVRSHWWLMNVYNSIVTDLNFELIFVGPNPPPVNQPLPANVRYIYATVKPVQCMAIGMFHAVGETWSAITDDVTFSKYAFDDAYGIYKESENYKTLISLNHVQSFVGNVNHEDLSHVLVDVAFGAAVSSRKFFFEIGGFHKDYTRNDYERDYFLNAYYNGGVAKLSKGIMFERRDCFKGVVLLKDMQRLWANWKIDGGKLIVLNPIKSFVFDETIYRTNQGIVDELWTTDTNTPLSDEEDPHHPTKSPPPPEPGVMPPCIG